MLDEFGIVKLDANDTIHKKQVEIRKMLKAILKEKELKFNGAKKQKISGASCCY